MNASSTALALRSDAVALPPAAPGWALLPPLGNLDAYISAVNRMPMLTPEQEQEYAHRLQEHNDLEAAGKLIMSHLRLVVSISRKYLGYGLPHADLIQEGNVGLMKAVRRFDPAQGVRLVTYAIHWIKAEIHEFILRNWRMVKVATTKAQRRLFFNLRSLRQNFRADAGSDATWRETLDEAEIDRMAGMLNVRREDVIEMETRMSGGDVQIDPLPQHGESDTPAVQLPALADSQHEPVAMLEARQREIMATDGIAAALEGLDARSRRIVEERWLKVRDDGSGGMTLHELAGEYGVSAERIRQIEVSAMKKMRKVLAEYA